MGKKLNMDLGTINLLLIIFYFIYINYSINKWIDNNF